MTDNLTLHLHKGRTKMLTLRKLNKLQADNQTNDFAANLVLNNRSQCVPTDQWTVDNFRVFSELKIIFKT